MHAHLKYYLISTIIFLLIIIPSPSKPFALDMLLSSAPVACALVDRSLKKQYEKLKKY